MDYDKNADILGYCGNPLRREPELGGIQYTVVTDMTTEPVILSDFKAHARIDYATDDTLCAMYLKAARQHLERFAQKSFGEKTIRITALSLPKNYRLMYGPVAGVTTPDYDAVGDILKGGPYKDVDIEYTTSWPALPEDIKVAICRYAAGLYSVRENLIFSVNGVPHEPQKWMDEAERMVLPWANITFP